MYEAVIWDFGGVLTSSPFEAFNTYEAKHGLPADFIRSVNRRNPDTNAWARFERAEVSAEEFDRLFLEEARAAGHEVPGRDVIQLLAGEVRPEMVRALERCKARLKVGCITNNVPTTDGHAPGSSAERARQASAIMALFDYVIESSRVGLRKPDPRVYLMMCEALSVTPGRCVYLDDLGINCKPAAALGMRAIKVGTPEKAIAELEEAVGFPLA